MSFKDNTQGKFNTALRFGITGLLGLFIFLQLSFVSEVKNDLVEHRKQVETQINTATIANRARLDINNCIVSVPPQTRTPKYVKQCYDDTEKRLNIKVERFGYGIENYVLPE